MSEILRTLGALLAGALAALLWADRQRSPKPARPEPDIEFVEQEVYVDNPEQAERISELESALAEQSDELAAERARREPPPEEPPPSIDAIRAARARAYLLERELSQRDDSSPSHWTELAPEHPDALADAVAEHLPRVAWHPPLESLGDIELAQVWQTLGAMHEFAEACAGDWFEFHGDFARWCRESGHPHALDPDVCATDADNPAFRVPERVNRSGQLVVPTYVTVGEARFHFVDDVAGETDRMHIVGVR